jgi:hypothetical protein
MKTQRERNQLLVRVLLLPTIFLSVALLGGLRVAAETHAFLFIAPPLVALVLAVLLMLLFVRGGLVKLSAWLSGDHAPSTVVSHALTLLALFFASAQAFTSVLPERGLFRWMFACFFLWTLWNNQFAAFDARRLLRSLVALFGTAFVLKHMLLASLYAPDGGWLKRLAATLLEGVTQGTVGSAQESFAPSTGYISFFTLALYVLGLVLLPPDPADAPQGRDPRELATQYRQLSLEERAILREEILRAERGLLEDEIHATQTD